MLVRPGQPAHRRTLAAALWLAAALAGAQAGQQAGVVAGHAGGVQLGSIAGAQPATTTVAHAIRAAAAAGRMTRRRPPLKV